MAVAAHLFIVSGPSGAGKSTILSAIRKKRPQIRYSISYTTRPPRGSERDGVDYHFVSESTFRDKMEAGDLAEWAEVHGYLYGTSASYIEDSIADGHDILLDIDVQGAKTLGARYPEAITVFVMPPTIKELERRLIKRGTDDRATVARRMKNAEVEMGEAYRYDHVIVNEDLAEAILKFETLIGEASTHG